MSLSVVVTAAGSSRRMQGVNKLLLELEGKPVLIHTLELFENLNFVSSVVVTASEACLDKYRSLCEKYNLKKILAVIEGGKERQDSIYAALQLLKTKQTKFVAVHDGARPLATPELVTNLYTNIWQSCSPKGQPQSEAQVAPASTNTEQSEHGLNLCVGFNPEARSNPEHQVCKNICGVIPGIPVKDTIKKVEQSGLVKETLNRDELRAVQTPQIFCFDILWRAYQEAEKSKFLGTDDASLVERIGGRVQILPGEATNLKITTVEDIPLARELMDKKHGNSR